MEDLPGDVRVDARAVVEHLRALVDNAPGAYPRTWLPQATFDELLVRADRDPIHLHPSLHHLHRRWDMGHARSLAGSGWGPKAVSRRLLARIVNAALDRYFTEEQEFRAALAQSIDAIAYRVDEIASSDLRALLEIVRKDLLELTRYVDDRIDTRLGDT
ncbi:MAG: hypothetical protein JWO62_2656 [Acidimicrobiaceae bacterium]|jgi:hypothetical protein|nr:hypothetical protein [Acidimicrobiaceae bacterium]